MQECMNAKNANATSLQMHDAMLKEGERKTTNQGGNDELFPSQACSQWTILQSLGYTMNHLPKLNPCPLLSQEGPKLTYKKKRNKHKTKAQTTKQNKQRLYICIRDKFQGYVT